MIVLNFFSFSSLSNLCIHITFFVVFIKIIYFIL